MPTRVMTAFACAVFALAVRAELTVDADFPGGNVVVEKVDGDRVLVRPDLRDTKGDWFYWCFRVKGAEGRTLTFKFVKGTPVGVRGPAVSTDGRASWKWLGGEKVDPTTFTYTFGADQREVYFGVGMTYTQARFDAFMKGLGERPNLRVETLSESKKRRPVEKLRLGKVEGEPKFRVLVTARHHACEMMASYAVEGIIQSVLAKDEVGKWFAENVEVMVVPFVDKDGVEDGDQGKNRTPRDHNRDYDGTSVHPETAALRDLVPKWAGGKLVMTIDLHCPTLRGAGNEFIYQVGQQSPEIWAEQKRLGAILEKGRQGTLVYEQANDYPFGKGWNGATNYTAGWPVGKWAGGIPGVRVATTFEIPYANASGKVVDQATGREFGRDLARAIKEYLGG